VSGLAAMSADEIARAFETVRLAALEIAGNGVGAALLLSLALVAQANISAIETDDVMLVIRRQAELLLAQQGGAP